MSLWLVSFICLERVGRNMRSGGGKLESHSKQRNKVDSLRKIKTMKGRESFERTRLEVSSLVRHKNRLYRKAWNLRFFEIKLLTSFQIWLTLRAVFALEA